MRTSKCVLVTLLLVALVVFGATSSWAVIVIHPPSRNEPRADPVRMRQLQIAVELSRIEGTRESRARSRIARITKNAGVSSGEISCAAI